MESMCGIRGIEHSQGNGEAQEEWYIVEKKSYIPVVRVPDYLQVWHKPHDRDFNLAAKPLSWI